MAGPGGETIVKSGFLSGLVVAVAVVLLAAFGPWLAREIASLPQRGTLAARSSQRVVTLEIGGMTCEGCAKTVRAQIAAIHGVSAVEVRLAQKRAYVVCERGVSDTALVAAVERHGPAYQAAVVAR
jgi:copper chaperone CopZ